jgi:hypothetical protein
MTARPLQNAGQTITTLNPITKKSRMVLLFIRVKYQPQWG